MRIIFPLLFVGYVSAVADWFFETCYENMLLNAATMQYMVGFDYDSFFTKLCSDEDSLLTMYDCFKTGATFVSASENNVIRTSYRSLKSTCSYYKVKPSLSTKELAEVYPTVNYKTFAEANATLEGPYRIPADMIEPAVPYASAYHLNMWASDQYGQATLYYVFGVMGFQIVFNFLSWVTPHFAGATMNFLPIKYFRRFVTMPPMFSSAKVSYYFQYYGEKLPIVLLFGYFVLNYVLMGVNYRIVPTEELTGPMIVGYYVGFRSGYMAMYKIPLVYLFGGRNNILIWLTGWDMNMFNHWHRWLARMLVIDVLIHFAAWSVYMDQAQYLKEAWVEPYWIHGVYATCAMFIMCIQSWKYIRMFAYDVFVAIHIVLAILATVGTFYHVKLLDETMELAYTMIAIWSFDRFVRCVRLAMGGICEGTVVEVTGDNILEIKIKHRNPMAMTAGSYVFVHFLDPLYFWQSHPFTVVDSPDGLKLLCKARKGITKRVMRKVRANSGKPLSYKMLIEGPYGVPVNFSGFSEISFIAGGIGITGAYSHLRHRIANKNSNQIAHLHWAMPDSSPLEWFAEELRLMLDAGIQVSLYITGPDDGKAVVGTVTERGSSQGTSNLSDKKVDEMLGPAAESPVSEPHIYYQRPDLEALVEQTIKDSTGSVGFFACGPPSLNHAVRRAVAFNLDKTSNYVQLYDESFCM